MTTVTGNGWTMHLGDCLDVMATLAPVDHVITDPPYEAEAHTKGRRRVAGAGLGAGVNRKVRDAVLPFAAMDEATRDASAAEMARLCGRWCLVFCQAEAAHKWTASVPMRSLRWMVWIKPDAQPQFTGDRPGMGYETIVALHSVARSRWNGGGKCGVFTHTKNDKAAWNEPKDHPTTKPAALMTELVDLFTDRGDVVLDPFAGSGTTGVACVRLGRRFVGIEKDPTYFALCVERLRAEEGGSTLQASRARQLGLLGGVK